jgi:hypothetical protein
MLEDQLEEFFTFHVLDKDVTCCVVAVAEGYVELR